MTAKKPSPWFAVAVRDMDRIRQNCPKQFPFVFAVWMVLVREAHFKRADKVTLTADIIADRTGISRRMVFVVSELLADLGLIKKQSRRDRTTGKNTPLVWTVKSAVSFKPSATDALGQSAPDALGSPSAQKFEKPCTHSYIPRRGNSKSNPSLAGSKTLPEGKVTGSADQPFYDWRDDYRASREG
jgi:hypothetical protein